MSENGRSTGINNKNKITDSLERGEPVFLVVGKLRHAHGVRGEITMEVHTDFPERIHPGITVYVGDEYQPLIVTQVRKKSQQLLLSFEGYKDCDQVNVLRNKLVYCQADKLPELPEGQYYHHQLIGLSVLDSSFSTIGSLVEILETGANDVYVVKSPDGSEILLPAVADVILDVDLEKHQMIIHPPEWA